MSHEGSPSSQVRAKNMLNNKIPAGGARAPPSLISTEASLAPNEEDARSSRSDLTSDPGYQQLELGEERQREEVHAPQVETRFGGEHPGNGDNDEKIPLLPRKEAYCTCYFTHNMARIMYVLITFFILSLIALTITWLAANHYEDETIYTSAMEVIMIHDKYHMTLADKTCVEIPPESQGDIHWELFISDCTLSTTLHHYTINRTRPGDDHILFLHLLEHSNLSITIAGSGTVKIIKDESRKIVPEHICDAEDVHTIPCNTDYNSTCKAPIPNTAYYYICLLSNSAEVTNFTIEVHEYKYIKYNKEICKENILAQDDSETKKNYCCDRTLPFLSKCAFLSSNTSSSSSSYHKLSKSQEVTLTLHHLQWPLVTVLVVLVVCLLLATAIFGVLEYKKRKQNVHSNLQHQRNPQEDRPNQPSS